jgi:tetratricopeptide (TPR) repeat protein
MAYSMLGALRMQLGYASEIWLAHLVKATELEPENPAWLMDLYDILTQVASIFPDQPFTQQDLLDETESRILAIFPGEPAVLVEMARRRWSLHDWDRAWELSVSAAQMAPGNLAAVGGLVLVCEKKGNCTEAIDHVLALDLGAGDEALEIASMLADALQKQDALADAEDLANRVLEKNPDISTMHLVLSEIMSRTCRLEEALGHAQKAIEIDPDDIFARAIEATVLTDLDRMSEAMQIAQGLVDQHPDSYLSWAIRSMVFYEMGDFEKALSDIDKASEVNPDSLFVNLAHSDTLFFLGRIEEAVDVADMACAGIKDEAACWSITGTLEAAQGNAADGVLLLEKALELEPENTHNEIYLAYALGEQEKNDPSVKGQAKEVFMKAVTAKPTLATKPWVLKIKAGIPGMKKTTLDMGPLSTCP